MVLNYDKRCGTVGNGQEQRGTLRDDDGLWCHDGGRSVIMGHDDLKMVTGG